MLFRPASMWERPWQCPDPAGGRGAGGRTDRRWGQILQTLQTRSLLLVQGVKVRSCDRKGGQGPLIPTLFGRLCWHTHGGVCVWGAGTDKAGRGFQAADSCAEAASAPGGWCLGSVISGQGPPLPCGPGMVLGHTGRCCQPCPAAGSPSLSCLLITCRRQGAAHTSSARRASAPEREACEALI